MKSIKNIILAVISGLGLLISLPLLVSADTANSTISVGVGSTITAFTTSGTVTLGALTPDATGRQSIQKDTVTVDTNSTSGYTLTLNDADTTYTLASGGNSFAATGGTPAAPAALSNNTWGWRVDSLSNFGAGPTSAASNAVPSSLTFAGIPANGSPFTVRTTATNGSSFTDIWYSARANNTLPNGTYTNIVTYTATVN